MNPLLKGGSEQVSVRGVGRALRPPGGRLLHGDPRRETGDPPETRHGTQEQRREGPQPLPGTCSTVPSLISICVSVLQFSATVESSEKCTILSQFTFKASILRCSKWASNRECKCSSFEPQFEFHFSNKNADTQIKIQNMTVEHLLGVHSDEVDIAAQDFRRRAGRAPDRVEEPPVWSMICQHANRCNRW